jgi:four helix bundle protein
VAFEEIIAWQKARRLTSAIYAVSRRGEWARDFGLSRQTQRAAVSIMSNIAEGSERGSPAEFHQFLCVAKASCAELRSQLYVALDMEYVTQDEFDDLMRQASEVSRVVGGLRAAIARKRIGPGPRNETPEPQHSELGSQH